MKTDLLMYDTVCYNSYYLDPNIAWWGSSYSLEAVETISSTNFPYEEHTVTVSTPSNPRSPIPTAFGGASQRSNYFCFAYLMQEPAWFLGQETARQIPVRIYPDQTPLPEADIPGAKATRRVFSLSQFGPTSHLPYTMVISKLVLD